MYTVPLRFVTTVPLFAAAGCRSIAFNWRTAGKAISVFNGVAASNSIGDAARAARLKALTSARAAVKPYDPATAIRIASTIPAAN